MTETCTDIKGIRESIRAGRVSPLEVVNECLERIEDLTPELNAFITVMAERARGLGYTASKAAIPFGNPGGWIDAIEEDRKAYQGGQI